MIYGQKIVLKSTFITYFEQGRYKYEKYEQFFKKKGTNKNFRSAIFQQADMLESRQIEFLMIKKNTYTTKYLLT